MKRFFVEFELGVKKSVGANTRLTNGQAFGSRTLAAVFKKQVFIFQIGYFKLFS